MKKIKNSLDKKNLKEDVLLKDRTTMKVGGKARYFFQANSIDQLVKAVKAARKAKIPHLILGNGSNLIFSQFGYQGLVIKNNSRQILIQQSRVVVDSGVKLDMLIRSLAEKGWAGLEFLTGIPGTVGGAVVNNAGAFGWQMEDVLKNVLLLKENGKQEIVSPKYFEFDYRKSKLKENTEGTSFPVILKAFLKIKKAGTEEVLRKISDYRKIRRKKQPQGFSAGCIFKNPRVKKEDIPEEWREVVKNGRISAGFLLDSAGAKDLRKGRAFVSDQHANYIINKGKAKPDDIKQLAEEMRKLVKDKYGLSISKEVQFVGQFEK